MSKKLTIITGGNSLRGFDFSKIKGDIMAINKTAFHIPKFKYVCALDLPMAHQLKHFKRKLHTIYDIPKVRVWTRITGQKLKKGYISTFEVSLCFALNIAWNMNYKEVYILGADNYIDNGLIYFWENEKNIKQAMRYNTMTFPMVDRCMQIISKQIDTKVYMVESNIECFNNLTMEEYEKL